LSNGKIIYIEAEEGLDGFTLVSKNMWANYNPHINMSPSKVADARVSTSPSLYARNVILSEDATKIRKDAENVIKNYKKIKEHRAFLSETEEKVHEFP